MWISTVHHREHASNVLLLPIRRLWSPFNPRAARNQPTCYATKISSSIHKIGTAVR